MLLTGKLEEKIKVIEIYLESYATAINSIDDYFEYSNESDVDKEVVMRIIDNLTNKLKEAFDANS